MKFPYTIYELATGKITRMYAGSNIDAQLQVGEDYVLGTYDDNDYYIDTGVAYQRPTMNLNWTGLAVSGVPTGSSVYVDNDLVATSDGTDITFNFDTPDIYNVRFELFPYIEERIVLDAS